METFLWVIIVLIGLSTLGRLIWLAKGNFPFREPKTEAIGVVINFAIITWGVSLLVGMK